MGRASGLGATPLGAASASGLDASQSSPLLRDRGEAQPKGDGLTPIWTDNLPEKPMLISEFPQKGSVYDYYYALDSSQWNSFSLDLALNEAQIGFSSRAPSQRLP
jgi:hypothetical protein